MAVIDAILGQRVPYQGTITVDRVDITPEFRRRYRRLSGYVLRDVDLLADTITCNVALGPVDDEIDHPAGQQACALAHNASFIEGTGRGRVWSSPGGMASSPRMCG